LRQCNKVSRKLTKEEKEAREATLRYCKKFHTSIKEEVKEMEQGVREKGKTPLLNT
jgi:hypothetical protein